MDAPVNAMPDAELSALFRFTREEVNASRDPNAIHHDLEAALALGCYDLIVPGAMLIEEASILMGATFQGSVFLSIQSLRFATPLLAGETAETTCKMVSLNEATRIAKFRVTIKRSKQFIASGVFSVRMPTKT